jgi:hypothetical protein
MMHYALIWRLQGCIVGMIFGILFGILFAALNPDETHQTIIEKGYGLYCPDTGEFAFIGECSK